MTREILRRAASRCFKAMAAAVCIAAAPAARADTGLYGGSVSGSFNLTDFPAETNVYATADMLYTNDKNLFLENTTWVYWGYVWLEQGDWYFLKQCWDDGIYLKIGNTVLINNNAYNATVGAVFTAPESGLYYFEIRAGQGTGGVGPTNVANGDGVYYWRGSAKGSTADRRKIGNYDSPASFITLPEQLLLIETSSGVDPGTTPACGFTAQLSQDSEILCSAPQFYSDSYGSCDYSLTGYRLYDCTVDSDTGTMSCAEVEGSPFQGASFTYVHGTTMRRLVWQYDLIYHGTNVYVGAASGDWNEPSNWANGAVPTPDDMVVIAGATVTLTGSGAETTVKNLTLKDGAFLVVQAPPAEDPKNFSTVYPSAYKFNVTETFKIERGATFQPVTDVLTGNPVFVNCQDFILEEGGQIEATAKGYGWASKTGVDFDALDALGHVYVTQNDGYSYCPGAGKDFGSTAGYGAQGSRVAYGYAYAPWLPGAVSGLYNKYGTTDAKWNGWARGGGAVVVFAFGKQTIAGDIYANGAYRFYNGSSGGGIWLVGNGFEIFSTAKLSANGSSDNYWALNSGGRISIGAGLTDVHVENLVTGQVPAQVSLACGDHLDFIDAHTYRGIGGTSVQVIDGARTEAGTRTYTVNTNELTLVAVKAAGLYGAEQLNGLIATPSSGMIEIPLEKLKLPSATNVHYTASAWRLLDGETELASGAGDTASYTFGDAKYALLTLEWTLSDIATDPEPDFFADVPEGTGVEKTFVGADGGDWAEAANWSPAGVPGLADAVTIAGKTVCATTIIGAGSLSVAADAKLFVGGTGEDVLAATAAADACFGLKVAGNCSIAGQVAIGGQDSTAPSRVLVGGDLTLDGEAVLAVYATRTSKYDFATLYAGATPVTVAGKLTLNDTARIVPDSDYLSGAAVRFAAGAVEIAEGAKFDAVARGWGWMTKTGEFSHTIRSAYYSNENMATPHCETYALGAGGRMQNAANGAGYGGYGDRYAAVGGLVYGYRYAPFLPGSCGHLRTSRGAGAIWIDCDGQFTLNGTLDASGTGGATSSSHANTSGGGIWVSALGFAAGPRAQLLASGGTSSGASYGAAGGRIALVIATTSAERDALARGETPDTLSYADAIAGVATVTVAGGEGSYASGTTPYKAEDGTVATVRGSVKAPMVHVTGDPVAAIGPTYGDIATSLGATVNLSAPAAYGADPVSSSFRYTCLGYLATNALGTVVAQGEGLTASFTVADEDVYFVWLWGNRQTLMEVTFQADSGGSVQYDGTVYEEAFALWGDGGCELEAIALDGYEFLYWIGDVPALSERQTKILLPGDAYRSVTPIFRRVAAAATRTWAGGEGDWTDPDQWADGVVPGFEDTAIVDAGVCRVSNYVACANLRVEGSAKLLAGCVLGSGKTTVVQQYPSESTTPCGGLFERIAVELSGTLSVGGTAEMAVGANGQSVYVQVEANDVALGGSAKLHLTAGPRATTDEYDETYDTGTGFLRIVNNLAIAETAQLYLRSDSYSGGSMVCTVGNRFSLAEGAAVNANDGGFWYDPMKTPRALEPLPQSAGGETYDKGASHGGTGWGSKAEYTYDFLYAPRMPGATMIPGYEDKASSNEPGGGVIRIHARSANIAGALKATTMVDNKWCASSGGSIWLTTESSLAVLPGAFFTVTGGRELYGATVDGVTLHQGGGGGRISICRGLTSDELAALVANGDALPSERFIRNPERRVVKDVNAFTNDFFQGVTVDVSGAPRNSTWGFGTFVFLDGKSSGMRITVR